MTEELVKTGRIVTVFGGSGFVGRHAVRALARAGWRVRVASRRPDLAFHLQPLGRVGQVHAVQANVRIPQSIAAAIRGADAVVNLVGVLTEAGRQRFDAVHAFGARAVARASRDAGIDRIVHVSAIGADPGSPSAYARSKAEGEAGVIEMRPGAVILRPSLVFGPEDAFFNRFAAIARFSPILPLIAGGQTRFQPVFVGDLAEAIVASLSGAATPGAIYEIGGPEVETFRRLMEFLLRTIERKRLLLPVPFGLTRGLAGIIEIANTLSLGLLPAELLLTRDQVELLAMDNIVSASALLERRTLEGLGIAPRALESIVPTYLGRYRSSGQFAGYEVG